VAERPPPPRTGGRRLDACRSCPAQQLLNCLVAADRAVLKPVFEHVRIRLAHVRTLRKAEDLHDLVAVEVGPDASQLLTLSQLGNPRLQAVVGTLKPKRF